MNGKGPKLDLKLNLSLACRANRPRAESPGRSSPSSSSSTSVSPTNSCVSSELINRQDEANLRYTNVSLSPMMLVGCPRCLMYIMLSEEEDQDPRCPRCKNTVLLDITTPPPPPPPREARS